MKFSIPLRHCRQPVSSVQVHSLQSWTADVAASRETVVHVRLCLIGIHKLQSWLAQQTYWSKRLSTENVYKMSANS